MLTLHLSVHATLKIFDEDTRNYQIAEGSHNYVINNYTASLEYPGDFPEDENPLGGDQLYCVTNKAEETDIVSRLNTGRGLITYSGHGSPIAWIRRSNIHPS